MQITSGLLNEMIGKDNICQNSIQKIAGIEKERKFIITDQNELERIVGLLKNLQPTKIHKKNQQSKEVSSTNSPLNKTSSTRFVQGRFPNGADKPIVLKDDDQTTYGDLQRGGVLALRKPMYEAYDKVPFYYSTFENKQVKNPDIKAVLGNDKAQQLLDGIEAHKEWAGINDAKVVFTPHLMRNVSNTREKLVAVNGLAPAIVHHELGHIATTPDSDLYKGVRRYAGPVGLVTSALATAAEKILGFRGPAVKVLRYGGAVAPLASAGLYLKDEYNASKNAKDFMKTQYPQEEQDDAAKLLNAGMYSHIRGQRRRLGVSLGAILANLAADSI